MKKNDIILAHGLDYKKMAKKVLETANLTELIGDKQKKVALKPNLVTTTPPSAGATTHAEILEGALEYLRENGFSDVTVMEGSWVGDRTQDVLDVVGYRPILKKYDVPFVDLQKDSWTEYNAQGMKIKLCDQAHQTDFMINLPVLKGHCQTLVTCALKNNKGVIPNSEKRRFHTMGLHKPIVHLNTIARNDFILVDNICGDLDFEEGGNPVEMNRILGFRDPVLCDAFVCETMGYSPEDVPYIPLAEELGVGSTDLKNANLIYVNPPQSREQSLPPTRRVQSLSRYAAPSDACSACYGSLIYALARLDDSGRLKKSLPKIAIGQGYRDKTGEIGVGQCTSCFAKTLQGCPPKAIDILKFLSENWKQPHL